MYIRSLHIDDFKMFKDFDIAFVDENEKALPIIVLAGIKGIGKTTLLEYISASSILSNSQNYLEVDILKEYTGFGPIMSQETQICKLIDCESFDCVNQLFKIKHKRKKKFDKKLLESKQNSERYQVYNFELRKYI